MIKKSLISILIIFLGFLFCAVKAQTPVNFAIILTKIEQPICGENPNKAGAISFKVEGSDATYLIEVWQVPFFDATTGIKKVFEQKVLTDSIITVKELGVGIYSIRYQRESPEGFPTVVYKDVELLQPFVWKINNIRYNDINGVDTLPNCLAGLGLQPSCYFKSIIEVKDSCIVNEPTVPAYEFKNLSFGMSSSKFYSTDTFTFKYGKDGEAQWYYAKYLDQRGTPADTLDDLVCVDSFMRVHNSNYNIELKAFVVDYGVECKEDAENPAIEIDSVTGFANYDKLYINPVNASISPEKLIKVTKGDFPYRIELQKKTTSYVLIDSTSGCFYRGKGDENYLFYPCVSANIYSNLNKEITVDTVNNGNSKELFLFIRKNSNAVENNIKIEFDEKYGFVVEESTILSLDTNGNYKDSLKIGYPLDITLAKTLDSPIEIAVRLKVRVEVDIDNLEDYLKFGLSVNGIKISYDSNIPELSEEFTAIDFVGSNLTFMGIGIKRVWFDKEEPLGILLPDEKLYVRTTIFNIGNRDFKDIITKNRIPRGFKSLKSITALNNEALSVKILDSVVIEEETSYNADLIQDDIAIFRGEAMCNTSFTVDINKIEVPLSPLFGKGIHPYNMVSTNYDNINDYFHIDNITAENHKNNRVIIIDKDGRKVDSFTNYDNNNVRWEGRDQKGKFVLDGLYYYDITIDGSSKHTRGFIYFNDNKY